MQPLLTQPALSSTYWRQLEDAREYQDFISGQLGIPFYASYRRQLEEGECKLGLEVKFDKRMSETGNLYLETAEKAASRAFSPSGIYHQDNTCLWLHGDYTHAFLFSKRTLHALVEKRLLQTVETPTSQGALLPLSEAERYALKVFYFNN